MPPTPRIPRALLFALTVVLGAPEGPGQTTKPASRPSATPIVRRLEALRDAPDRAERALALVKKWHEKLAPVPPTGEKYSDPRADTKAAGRQSEALRSWIDLVGPGPVLREVRSGLPIVRRRLSLSRSAGPRRRLLAHVADALARAPKLSALETLCRTLDWSVALTEPTATPRTRLDQVSADLVLVFTERSTGGVSRSAGAWYRDRKLLDSGFHADLRDGSDQVRHGAWAFRMFATSKDPRATSEILRMKEMLDARRRGHPLSEADLALNARMRGIVEILLDPDVAPSADSWAQLMRRRLGS